MSWDPDSGFLAEVLELLDALSDPASHDHQEAQEALAEQIGNGEFIPYLGLAFSLVCLLRKKRFLSLLYLAFCLHSNLLTLVRIFSTPLEGVRLPLRELAGLIVKREVIGQFDKANEDLQAFLQEELLRSMAGNPRSMCVYVSLCVCVCVDEEYEIRKTASNLGFSLFSSLSSFHPSSL